ncbi:MAG: cytochrome P450, partial [Aldersonia sp.]|nr:cytochrome P450 [Aldersonia sp.]
MTTFVDRAEIGFGNLAEKYPSQVKPLATPPPGSGLKPVMGDYGAPIIGHTLGSLGDLLAYVRKRYARYGAVSWSGTLGTRMVGAFGPDAIEAIAMTRDKAFGNEGFYTYLIGAFFRRGVMLM